MIIYGYLFCSDNPKFDLICGEFSSLGKTVAALRAGAEYVGVPFQSCVLIAGSQSGVSGAEQIGMPCVVLRSR